MTINKELLQYQLLNYFNMQSINLVAENIAFKLGDQFNFTLRESIKDTLLNYRAKFIRDDADRNSLSEVHFSQTAVLQFKVVNLLSEFNADFACLSVICGDVHLQEKYNILKSKTPVPTPIRFKQSSKAPFMYLGRVDGSKSFVYTTLDMFPYLINLPYSSKVIYYTIINNHVFILNNLNECDINESLKICNILLKGIFENPSEFYSICDNGDTFVDDMPFPIGKDMLMQISNAILKGEYPIIPKDGQQVNIKPDDND